MASVRSASFLAILLDLGVLVVDVQLGVTPSVITRVRNGPGWPAARCVQLAVEDQSDLVGTAGVEVVADDLLEEHPPGHRPVQHLGH